MEVPRVHRLVTLLAVLPCVFAASAAELPRDPSEAVAQRLGKLTTALRDLKPEQIRAVAGLVLADRAGVPIEQYCPPLKQFSAARMPCLSEMASYARATKDCKKADPTWRECPKVVEAEAAWGTCSMKEAMANLDRLAGMPIGPRPIPTPTQ
jgi:hypothetical protein